MVRSRSEQMLVPVCEPGWGHAAAAAARCGSSAPPRCSPSPPAPASPPPPTLFRPLRQTFRTQTQTKDLTVRVTSIPATTLRGTRRRSGWRVALREQNTRNQKRNEPKPGLLTCLLTAEAVSFDLHKVAKITTLGSTWITQERSDCRTNTSWSENYIRDKHTFINLQSNQTLPDLNMNTEMFMWNQDAEICFHDSPHINICPSNCIHFQQGWGR